CAELDDGLVHRWLDLLFKDNFPILEDLLDVRPKLARLRIDNREFLFDTESKRVVLDAHRGRQMSPKNNLLSSRVEDDEGMWERPQYRDGRDTKVPPTLPVDLMRGRLTNAASRPPERTCPSSSCRDRAYARALCESPSRKRLQPPTRNLPDQLKLLRRQERDYKNRSPPARRRGSQTRPCLSRNREIDSTRGRLVQPFAKSPAARATQFDNADDTAAAVRTA